LSPGGITLHRRIEVGLPAVMIDKVQIQQVLINLMRNAAEAMRQSRPGDITVSARRVDGSIEIAVADNGPGLPKALQDRLFEPFVSTKAGGMGVGLSICHAIIESHGGAHLGGGKLRRRHHLPLQAPFARRELLRAAVQRIGDEEAGDPTTEWPQDRSHRSLLDQLGAGSP
jgi:C4-dicarboxylate-specific signal transduction histidine kinase